MRAYVLMSLSAVSLVAACASTPDSGPMISSSSTSSGGEMTEAQRFFEENLVSVFEQSCSNCHANAGDSYQAPDYLGTAGTEGYYASISTRTDFLQCEVDRSPLLLKGADPTHPGASFATADAPTVQQWLELEAVARFGEVCHGSNPTGGAGGAGGDPGGGGGAGGEEPPPVQGWPPVTGADHMKAFGDCATYTDWVDSGMPQVAKQQANHQGNNTPCYNCHNNYQVGLNHMPNPNDTTAVKAAFKNMRYMWGSFNLVRWTVNDDPGATFKDLVKSYLWRDTGVSNTQHPTYTLSATYLGYYEDWYSRTRARYDEALSTGIPCDAAAGDPTP